MEVHNPMNDTLYITNKTNGPIVATIYNDYTGGQVKTFELKPGPNEIPFAGLDTGVYMIQLEDNNHDIFYKQQLVRA